jgi:hypothetical protein
MNRRHCEEQRDEAIQSSPVNLDCFRRRPSGYGGQVASLAMTERLMLSLCAGRRDGCSSLALAAPILEALHHDEEGRHEQHRKTGRGLHAREHGVSYLIFDRDIVAPRRLSGADAIVCARGVVRAGCAGTDGAVVVRRPPVAACRSMVVNGVPAVDRRSISVDLIWPSQRVEFRRVVYCFALGLVICI